MIGHSEHPDFSEIEMHISHQINTTDEKEIREHLETCSRCYEEYLLLLLAEHYSRAGSIPSEKLLQAIRKEAVLQAGSVSEKNTVNPVKKQTKKKSKVFYIIPAAVAAFLAVAVWLNPVRETKQNLNNKILTENITAVLTFAKGTVNVNGKTAIAGEKLLVSDTISTEHASSATLQFSTSALITLKADTVIQIAKLKIGVDGRPDITVNQENGSTFSKVLSGKAEYRISTPTAVAGVRGTAFSVKVDKTKNSSIHLLHGKVAVRQISRNSDNISAEAKSANEIQSKEPLMLNAGEKIIVTKVQIAKPEHISEKEKKEMLKFDEQEFRKTEEVQVMVKQAEEKINRQNQEKNENAAGVNQQKPQHKKMTLAELKKKYGNLSTISTTDGKVFIGAFNQSGSTMNIHTVNGEVKVPVGNISKVSPLK